jgi:hypothetical protein
VQIEWKVLRQQLVVVLVSDVYFPLRKFLTKSRRLWKPGLWILLEGLELSYHQDSRGLSSEGVISSSSARWGTAGV